jgi:transcriptional regulator with XRE-family HTH domain
VPRLRRPRGRGDSKTETFDPLDIYIGKRVRERRRELGISQRELADALGLSYQQLQKYECADDRISASRLFHISKILGVTLPFFFKGCQEFVEDRTSAGSAERVIPGALRGPHTRRFARRTRMMGRSGQS